MLGALDRTFPDEASWSRPEGGYFLWLALADGSDGSALAARAAEAGVAIVRGDDFFPPTSDLGVSAARLAFSYEPPERIVEGIERLAGVLERARVTRGRGGGANRRRGSRARSRGRGRAG
jgi:2-aminoadipate transaminase